MSAVEVVGLGKVFNAGKAGQVDALVDINVSIEPGEFISLIGPSGCGKSTLLRLIANLTEPSARAKLTPPVWCIAPAARLLVRRGCMGRWCCLTKTWPIPRAHIT